MGAYTKGGLKIFLEAGHIPVEICLLVRYLLDAAHTSNRMFFKGLASFH